MRKKDSTPKKTERIIKRQKTITARLLSSIALIFFAAVSVITLSYNALPEWVYYLNPAVRLYFASDEIESAYGTARFLDVIRDVEKRYDSNVEIFNKSERFIYSTLNPDIEFLPDNLTYATAIDSKYRLTYKTSQGDVSTGDKGFIIKVYESGNIDVDFLVCYAHLSDGSRVEVCMQVSQVISTSKIDFILAFGFILSALALGFLMLILYLRRFSKPIDNMCEITERMSKLDFSKKCPPTKLIEMTQLSESINTMSDALDEALTDLNEKNEKLLRDIENERTIDNLRQTFISGISHELKTPIAIIQGYAEGAKMFYEAGNGKAASEYCDIIGEETVRMNNMIMRLLEITKYSSGAYEPVHENFSIRHMVQDWFDRNTSLITEKGITAVNEIDASFVGIGDSIILDSVVNNYLSNAVSHIGGERRIICRAEDMGSCYRIFVGNTGDNIEEKHIDKIWDSFYRADKSLSRSQGRFGLGLAIVASIQKLHDMDYGVNNTADGVEFYFDIRKAE